MPEGAWHAAALVLIVLALLLLFGWYLSLSASRLDRLHHRVESARAALDAALMRRAVAALDAAALLDPATGLLVVDSAAAALDAAEQGVADSRVDVERVEEVENDLTRTLHAAFDDPAAPGSLAPPQEQRLTALGQAMGRVQLARRFHNDAVAQAQRVRRKRIVRWARLAGHAPPPSMLEIDDSLPPGLVS